MIDVVHLSKKLGHQHVLKDISFKVNAGEIVVLLGSSGTGKTVLLKHLIGLMRPDSGQVIIDGVDISLMREDALLDVRRQFGYLFQEGALYDFMDVFENIAFPLREHTDFSAAKIKDRVQEVLNLVDLADVGSKLPSELSGGMKKRVGLARAIVLGAKILLCDEPTSGLDPIRSRDISDLIRSISKKLNSTTVITSHDIDNALRIGDRFILLNEGAIAVMGNKEALLSSTDKFVQEFLYAQTAR